MNKLLDLYTDYLQVTFGQASATGLSSLLDSAVSHDKFTRLLSTNEFSSIDLWFSVKALVREHQSDDACLIFDDVIVHKPHTDESELVTWHFDHTENRSVKGINLLTAFYHSHLPTPGTALACSGAFSSGQKRDSFLRPQNATGKTPKQNHQK